MWTDFAPPAPCIYSTHTSPAVHYKHKAICFAGLSEDSHTVPAFAWDSKITTLANSLFTCEPEHSLIWDLIKCWDVHHVFYSWRKVMLVRLTHLICEGNSVHNNKQTLPHVENMPTANRLCVKLWPTTLVRGLLTVTTSPSGQSDCNERFWWIRPP